MKYFLIFAFAFSVFSPVYSQEENTQKDITTYYFIRHAEKDRSDPTNSDPKLSEAGKNRAEQWNEILKNITFDAIYSTAYHRTIQTAKPTADRAKLDILFYDPSTLYSPDFTKDTNGKTVLVVGHSNTTPDFVNQVLGEQKHEAIDDLNNGNLYIVTISETQITDHVLTIN